MKIIKKFLPIPLIGIGFGMSLTVISCANQIKENRKIKEFPKQVTKSPNHGHENKNQSNDSNQSKQSKQITKEVKGPDQKNKNESHDLIKPKQPSEIKNTKIISDNVKEIDEKDLIQHQQDSIYGSLYVSKKLESLTKQLDDNNFEEKEQDKILSEAQTKLESINKSELETLFQNMLLFGLKKNAIKSTLTSSDFPVKQDIPFEYELLIIPHMTDFEYNQENKTVSFKLVNTYKSKCKALDYEYEKFFVLSFNFNNLKLEAEITNIELDKNKNKIYAPAFKFVATKDSSIIWNEDESKGNFNEEKERELLSKGYDLLDRNKKGFKEFSELSKDEVINMLMDFDKISQKTFNNNIYSIKYLQNTKKEKLGYLNGSFNINNNKHSFFNWSGDDKKLDLELFIDHFPGYEQGDEFDESGNPTDSESIKTTSLKTRSILISEQNSNTIKWKLYKDKTK